MSYFFLISGVALFFSSSFFFKSATLMSWGVIPMNKIMNLDLLILLDWVSVIFLGTLFMIVSCVLSFSNFYMKEEKFQGRFTSILLIFMFSMCLLILIPHFVFVLVGWDGLGFSSFLLVIYYKSFSSWSSGLKTYLLNRLGDSFLVVSAIMFFNQGHWMILSLDFNIWWLSLTLLVLGFFTKSAQYPFSSWLPAAMAAPTPVSALVHSSTLVTAGIFLLIRFSNVFSESIFFIICVVGLWTLFSASFSACVEWDFKKMIAFSTLSQLGLMCFSIGLGMSLFSFFHLLTHAVFKAMLFISAGFLIGNNFHLQDIRNLSNNEVSSPLISISFFVGLLSLSGFPFLAGFFSKDAIIESNLKVKKVLLFFLFFLSLIFTVFYSFRVFFYVFQLNNQNLISEIFSPASLFSLLPLFFCSLCLGSVINQNIMESKYPSFSLKILILFLLTSGFFFSLKSFRLSGEVLWVWSKLNYVEPLNSIFLVKSFSGAGNHLFNFDQSLVFSIEKSFKTSILGKYGLFNEMSGFFDNLKISFYSFSFVFLMIWILFIF